MFRLLTIVAICITLLPKLYFNSVPKGEFLGPVVQFLSDNKFSTSVGTQTFDGVPVIMASNGACSLVVMKASPDGWNGPMLRAEASRVDELFFVYRGRIYKEQSVWKTTVYAFLERQASRVGLAKYERAVIAVAQSRNCNTELLAWGELSV